MAIALPIQEVHAMEVFNWDEIRVLVRNTECSRNCLTCVFRGHSLRQTVKQSISSEHDLKSPLTGGGVQCNVLATE